MLLLLFPDVEGLCKHVNWLHGFRSFAAKARRSDSLLFEKVNSKLLGTNPPCGSPMPLPATGTPLTAAQVSLIAAWIDNGAKND